ncbi:hypothetical protein [Sulfitobacter sp. BSw21498]|uniref:hypothetical protein n=1 Tax=Sulfitobacter sp. BSw21498 TaxID=664426 RepID=UPI001110B631|nr:hypothetical protein [Sulfitobacter sp. BSw21498]|tara:strand:- start:230 stop:502 length:273 start_codon:yes stop_codon:yes gene_type:complete
MTKGDLNDPKGLIYESYRIPGITPPECRSIFLDWALSLPMESDTKTALRALLDQVTPENLDHPMTGVMQEGLIGMATPRRRGGWKTRPRS